MIFKIQTDITFDELRREMYKERKKRNKLKGKELAKLLSWMKKK